MPLGDYFLELQRAQSIGKCDDPNCPTGVKCLAELKAWRDGGAFANSTLVHNGCVNCQYCGFGGWVFSTHNRCSACRRRSDAKRGNEPTRPSDAP